MTEGIDVSVKAVDVDEAAYLEKTYEEMRREGRLEPSGFIKGPKGGTLWWGPADALAKVA